jgi:type IV fimbrial biogenesis protein FimT
MSIRLHSRLRCAGFTMVELMVALVVAAVLVAIAIPSFTGMLARNRLDGVFNELQTDVQLARTESVSRNLPVRVTFGVGCYVIHTHPAGAGATSCSQGGPSTIGASATEIKTMQLQPGTSTSFAPQSALAYVEFDPVRGTATWGGGAVTGSVNVNSSAGVWQLQLNVLATGRVQTCSPGGSMKGYTTC